MRTTRVQFRNEHGIMLAGSLDLPRESPPRAWALFAHCFTCNRNYKFIRHLSRTLAPRGIAVLRLDFTGLGESEGAFEDTNFSTTVDDVVAAARFLAAEHQPPQLLIGHSLGGTAVLAAATRLAETRAVATINAPFEPAHVIDQLGDIDTQFDRLGYAEVHIGGTPYRITPQLIEDLRAVRMEERIGGLDSALLVLHSTMDRTAGIEHAERILAAAHHPKSLVALAGADHLLSREADARYAGRVIATWSFPYLGDGAE